MNISEASKMLRKSPQFIRIGLQQGRLPFGSAVRTSSRWSYDIRPEALERYIKGE